jgi:NADPH:quinone reductase-like Zn-dependent oxidoreductase
MKATDGKGVTCRERRRRIGVRRMHPLDGLRGRLATVGYVDGQLKAEIDIQALHSKRLTLFGVSNKLRTPEQRAAAFRASWRTSCPRLAAGRISPVIEHVYPFEELPAARAHMESNRHVGKIVLKVQP